MKIMHSIHLVSHRLKSLNPSRSGQHRHPQFSLFFHLLAPKYTSNIRSRKAKARSFSRAANCSALCVIVRLGERKGLFSSAYKNLAGFREPFQLSSDNSRNEFHFTRLKFNVNQTRSKDRSSGKKTAKLCLG